MQRDNLSLNCVHEAHKLSDFSLFRRKIAIIMTEHLSNEIEYLIV